jgi:hypothetical protein
MSNETQEIAVIEQNPIAQTTEQNMIAVLAKIASDPSTDVDKIERLLDVQIKMLDRQAKMDFDQALARVQSQMPRIKQNGSIKTRDGKVTSRYMKYEDIDLVIRPMLQEEGLSLVHDREEMHGKMIVKTTLKHRGGHQETVSIPLPYDTVNALKSAVQAAVSTFSYGKRVNVCSIFNLVAEGEDDDGADTHIKIDEVQAAHIKDTLHDTNSDVARFLEYMGVDCVDNIPMKDYTKATNALKRKAAAK